MLSNLLLFFGNSFFSRTVNVMLNNFNGRKCDFASEPPMVDAPFPTGMDALLTGNTLATCQLLALCTSTSTYNGPFVSLSLRHLL